MGTRMSEQPSNASGTRFCEIATAAEPFEFATGGAIGPAVLAYETFGTLNADKSNAVLVFHALTGSHHAAGIDAKGPGGNLWTPDCHTGWWDDFLGPHKAIDTTRFFVICANYLGSCYGSTGPNSVNPATGKPYGREFPWPTIRDFVDSQVRLLDRLGIGKLHAVMGGSVGGFCAADFAVRYADRVGIVMPIASGLRVTEATRVMNFEQIYAIEADPHFNGGDYYEGEPPRRGLTLARMIGHKTFVALRLMKGRAKQQIIQPEGELAAYMMRHSVESYMLYQGRKFVNRFDANAYLRIMHAWQTFDLPAQEADGDAVAALRPCRHQKWMLFSIDSDVCFFPEEQAEMADALKAATVPHTYITVHSDKGHDAFLLEPDLFGPHIRWMLEHPGAVK